VLEDVQIMLERKNFCIVVSSGVAGNNGSERDRDLDDFELDNRFTEAARATNPGLYDLERSLAIQATFHQEVVLSAIDDLHSGFASPNNELLLVLQGVVPERMQARDPKTNEPLVNEAGEPIRLEQKAMMHQLQRYKRFIDNGTASVS
jgi:hypothetical protein